MSDTLWGVVIGGAISTLATLVAGWLTERRASSRQAAQFEHERSERRFDAALSAYVEFAAAMREAKRFAANAVDSGAYPPPYWDQDPTGDWERYEDREAEAALERLRYVAPAEIHKAGRAYLDAHYDYWAPLDPKKRGGDMRASTEAEFMRVARESLRLESPAT